MSSQLTRSEVWKILQDSKPTIFKPPDIEIAFQNICQQLNVKEHPDIKTVLSDEIKEFLKSKKNDRNVDKARRNTGNLVIILRREDYLDEEDTTPLLGAEVLQEKNIRTF